MAETTDGPGIYCQGSGNGWYATFRANMAPEGGSVGDEVYIRMIGKPSFRNAAGSVPEVRYDQKQGVVIVDAVGWAGQQSYGNTARASAVIDVAKKTATWDVWRGDVLLYAQEMPTPLLRAIVDWE